MGKRFEAVRKLQAETAEKIIEGAGKLKESVFSNIQGAYKALRGSGSVMQEFEKAKTAAFSVPGDIDEGCVRTTANLATGRFGTAAKEAIVGTVKTLKDVGKAIAVPFVSTTVAMGGKMVGAGKKAVAVPGKVLSAVAQGPIKAFGVIKKGVTDFFESPPAQTSAPVSVDTHAAPPPLPDRPTADTSMPEDNPETEEKPADKPAEDKLAA